ncbi:MAG: DNA polymerase III subunit gamma/tau [Halanaerobiaceae bacterium]
MGFLSLYRKYRPRTFDDLVGQKHVVRTLENALENNRIAHAYLFAGPRGTGKTSTAKIYAQALNCVEGPTSQPCGDCEVCQKIQSGQSIDVMEIDAASNRGIDEIRDLREKVKFYPSEGKYKVYIIDEVHMLTRGAFNALLKTLEEPPENVVFILATTEPHKVIDTILSRCQRFDFTLLASEDIKERLIYICQHEDVDYENQALNLITAASNGGLRDAISLLDQAISFCDGNLRASEIQEMLGKVDISFLKKFIDIILNQNNAKALEMIDQIINSGKGISMFVNDLVEFLRQIMLYKKCGNKSSVFNFTEEIIKNIEELVGRINTAEIIRYIDILTKIEREMGFADQPRIILEMGIIKIASYKADNSLDGLRKRIAEIEYKLRQMGSPGKKSQDYAQKSSNMDINNSKELDKDISGNKDKETSNKPGTTSKENSGLHIESNNDLKSSDRTGNKEVREASITDKTIKSEQIKDNIIAEESNETKKNSNKGGLLPLVEVENAWPVILDKIKDESISIHAMIMEGKPVQVKDDNLFIQFPTDKNFHKKGAQNQASVIKRIISQVLGVSFSLIFINENENINNKRQDIKEDNNNINKNINQDKIDNEVEKVLKAFNGQIIKVNHKVLDENKN